MEYIEKYKIRNILGQGAFSTVYRTRHSLTNLQYAIKKINIDKLTKVENEYVKSEVLIMQQIRHDNIVRLIEIIQNSNNMYLVLEFCNSGTVKDMILYFKEYNKNKERIMIYYFEQMTNALIFLSNNKILHRDLKPQNILINSIMSTHRNYHEYKLFTLKICDFGFSKIIQKEKMNNTICGSPLYLAPEMFFSDNYDEQVDIWSLGCIFYELAFSKHPIDEYTINDIIKKLKNFKLDFPKHKYTDNFIDFINSCLVINPNDRIKHKDIGNHPIFDLNLYIDDDFDYIDEDYEVDIIEKDEYDIIDKKVENNNIAYSAPYSMSYSRNSPLDNLAFFLNKAWKMSL